MDFENLKKKLAEAGNTMVETGKQQQELMRDPSFIPGESMGLAGLLSAAGKLSPDPIEIPGGKLGETEYPSVQMDPISVMGSMRVIKGAGDALKGANVAKEVAALTPEQKMIKAVDNSASNPNLSMDELKMITQRKSRLMDLLKRNPAAK